jgi:hypothetical protein
MLAAVVLSTWVFLVTIVMPGHAPLVYEASSFSTAEACERFKALFIAVYQEDLRRAQARMPSSDSPRYERTYTCVERS